MNDSFRVAFCRKAVAFPDQILAQRLIIVDLAVEDNPHRAVLVGDWLMTCSQIDNAQPPHADRAAAIHVEALIIGPAMDNLIAHGLHAGN